ncbi:MAG: hypothetical protein DMF59_08375 [Acidobacteria bacterium]|nr:MAG: hypothetical protein DMF59_08375 [Acidobacteriota bacterium]
MLLSFVLWGGLFLTALAVILAIPRRTRRLFLRLATTGVVMILGAAFWPAPVQYARARATHLDEAMPSWEFDEQHEIHVNAPPQKVFDSIRPVTAGEIRYFRTLIAMRRLGRPLPPGILNAPENEPLLDLATRTSFRYVANDPPHELVVETIVMRPHAAVATMNFLVTPEGNGSRLSTETRVYANTDSARRRFAVYWRIIHPGSDIIRRMWLRAIKERAERSS